MSRLLNKIEKILNEQIDKISDKSRTAKLALEEVDVLQRLAKIQLDILASSKRGPYSRRRVVGNGESVSDEDLMKYATDKSD